MRSFVDFLVLAQLCLVADRDRCEESLREDREYCVVVVLADGEVNVASRQHVLAKVVDVLEVGPLLVVSVSFYCFLLHAVPQSHELHHILCSLFEDD